MSSILTTPATGGALWAKETAWGQRSRKEASRCLQAQGLFPAGNVRLEAGGSGLTVSEVKVWGILFPSMGKQWRHQMYMRNTQNKCMTANWPQRREDQCHATPLQAADDSESEDSEGATP